MAKTKNNFKKVKKIFSKFDLGLLQNLYCSCQSEISLALMFLYQSNIIKKENPEIGKTFFLFFKQSIRQSNILANLILENNGLPFYINSQNSPLTSLWIDENSNYDEILKFDKKYLLLLIEKYQKVIEKINNKNTKLIILNLKKNNEKILYKIKKLISLL